MIHIYCSYVIAIIIYWGITFAVYVPYLILNVSSDPYRFATLNQLMLFLITCKGYFDFIVWFQINELAFGYVVLGHFLTIDRAVSSEGLFRGNSGGAKKPLAVDVDLSPQVNMALRCEVL